MTLQLLFLILFIATILLIAVAFLIDFKNHLKAKKEFHQKYGPYIGQTLKVKDQNEEFSKLENNIQIYDTYTERGVTTRGFKKGDLVKIGEYPKFNPFKTQAKPFKLV